MEELQKKVDELQGQLSIAETDRDELQGKLTTAETRITRLETSVDDANALNAKLSEENNELQAKVKELSDAGASLEAEVKALQAIPGKMPEGAYGEFTFEKKRYLIKRAQVRLAGTVITADEIAKDPAIQKQLIELGASSVELKVGGSKK